MIDVKELVKELRIGNYINFCNKPTKVWCLFEDSINDELDIYISPIKLDEQILLKCGYRKHNSNFDDDTRLSLYTRLDYDGYFAEWDGKTIKVIKYIHELQNLYKEMTNLKLEVNI